MEYLSFYAGMLGTWLCCCHSILWSGGDVNWYHHPFILPGFWRAPRNSPICSSPSHWDAQWPKRDAETYPMTLLKHPRFLFLLFSYLLEFENLMIFYMQWPVLLSHLLCLPCPPCFCFSFSSWSVSLELFCSHVYILLLAWQSNGPLKASIERKNHHYQG